MRRIFVWAVLAWGASMAGCGPSPARLACIDHCHVGHDRCLITAVDADGLQACDHQVSACMASCPAR